MYGLMYSFDDLQREGSHISGICRFLDFGIIRQMSVKILKLNLNILWTHSEWQICSCTRWMSQVYGYFEQAVRPSASATMQEALALASNKMFHSTRCGE